MITSILILKIGIFLGALIMLCIFKINNTEEKYV